MEGAVLSSPTGSGFRTHLKNAASSLCTRTLPKQHQRHDDGGIDVLASGCGESRHHTYPRATTPRRAALSCRLELEQQDTVTAPAVENFFFIGNIDQQLQPNSLVKLRGSLSREVAAVWHSRVGTPDQPAPIDRVQSLFNDIDLYPTKPQVFEMLMCARRCARRKSLTLTFGEFCVFAAELRKCARQTRQVRRQPDPESPQPQWNVDVCKHIVNGSEGTPAPCEVFLGGSCNPTTWRSDIAIPMLNQMGITYFNPQVDDWSTDLMEVEHRAKAEARALLFVLDSETRAVAASVEAAYLAASPRDLLLVLRPYVRNQKIGRETITDHEYLELTRARVTLQEAVERRGLPVFPDIPQALRCAGAVVRGLLRHPSLSHTILRLRRAFDGRRPRSAQTDTRPALTRAAAAAALAELTHRPPHVAERTLPHNLEQIDFETFCAAVAELATSTDSERWSWEEGCGTGQSRLSRALRSLRRWLSLPYARQSQNGEDDASRVSPPSPVDSPRSFHSCNERLRACGRKLGIVIPKSESRRTESETSSDSVLTPGTEQRLERLPSMLNTKPPQIYIAGTFPSNGTSAEEYLRGTGVRWVVARANDYSRMFSVTASRRSADVHPESPRADKKPRPDRDAEKRLRSERDAEKRARSEREAEKRARSERDAEKRVRSESDAEKRARSERDAEKRILSERDAERRVLSERDAEKRTRSDREPDVELRPRHAPPSPADRLSASDFYNVTDDVTPQPFKGTYDDDLISESHALVFAISSETPCFSTMVLAAHYLGLRPRDVILLVQPMKYEPGSVYSEAAVKDYNRGRHYLTDLARRAEVPVFDCAADTLAAALARTAHTPV